LCFLFTSVPAKPLQQKSRNVASSEDQHYTKGVELT
jgi:hypothetical protein